MVFRYGWDLIECEYGIEGLCSFQSVLAHDLAYLEPFSLQVALMKDIFLIAIYSMQCWAAYSRHTVIRKRSAKKIKAYRESL